MKKTETYFSIIIPTYNNKDAVLRISNKVLSLDYNSFELIVVVDGSKDGTHEALLQLRDSRMRILYQNNHGVSAARNAGLKKAKGDYLLFLDDDDDFADDILYSLNNAIVKNNFPDFIRYSGLRQKEDGSFVEIGGFSNKDLLDQIINPKNKIDCYSPLLTVKNKDVIPYREDLRYLEDDVFYLDNITKEDKRLVSINDKLYIYLYNPHSKTKNLERLGGNVMDLIRSSFCILNHTSINDKRKRELVRTYIVNIIYRKISEAAKKLGATSCEFASNYAAKKLSTYKIKPSLIRHPKSLLKYYRIMLWGKKAYRHANGSILTLNGFTNYGNRLQLFALSTIMESLNQIMVTYWPKKMSIMIKEFIKYHPPFSIRFQKETKLECFTKDYIPKVTRRICTPFTVVGSDQVWNPNYYKKSPYLLKPLGDEIRISYAASLGVGKLTKDQKEQFKQSLSNYKNISVREKAAQALLQPLTDKKIEVVLDPTLLLDKSEYTNLEKKPKNIKEEEKYILCYVLGNRECMNAINEYAKKHNYRVLLFSDKKDSNYGVEEFLYLIHHAELVCTDSFHACVFSFIFDRPFVAFRRTGEADYMYSRLENLIETFKFKNREFNGKCITEENAKVDYNEAKRILKKEQKKSIRFLKNALGVKDEA